MSTCWTIFEFDGYAVELTRRAWLLPWGRTTRFALDSLLVLDIPRRRSRDNAPRDNNVLVLHGEDGARAWTEHIFLGRSARRLGRFVWFTYCVNEALAERVRLLLAARGPSTPGGPAAWDAEYTEMIMRLLCGPPPRWPHRGQPQSAAPLDSLTTPPSGHRPLRELLADGRLNEFWLFVRSPPAPVNWEPRAEFVLRWGRELHHADFRPSVAWDLNYKSADWGRILGKLRHRLLAAAVRHAVDHPDLDVEDRPHPLRRLWRWAGFDEYTVARHAHDRLSVTAGPARP
ncbi:hypothetical protein [Streptomyces sp. SID12501]|uniref:Uncharacterized protein n=1 Tax=Streptomyces sp. SID12501 TaxID=2706042 RepID=A0A6B3C724_9ACTN|nr:hypothetical protein [Streptomyces sp. SID12501]NEC92603.1 hypothetical protein [Streptomyces sp. SID12501]